MSARRWPWIVWAVALAAVVLAMAWQVVDAEGRIDCVLNPDELLILCAGGLDAWVTPALVGIGMVLIVIGAWALLARRR